MNEDTLEAARAELQAIRDEVREDLATDLGGDPDDYRVERTIASTPSDADDSAVPDGGE